MERSGLTNLCVLQCRQEPLYHGLGAFGSRLPNLADGQELHKEEKENDSYHWRQRERWKICFAGSDPEGTQGSRDVQVQGRGGQSAFGMRGGAWRVLRPGEA